MKKAYFRILAAFSFLAVGGIAHALEGDSQGYQDPCKAVRKACQAAGYTTGGGENGGKGLYICISKYQKGGSEPGVNVSAEDAASCVKEKYKNGDSGSSGSGALAGMGSGKGRACQQIRDACQAAGYVEGGAQQGKGLHKCVNTIKKGGTVDGVSVDAETAATCKNPPKRSANPAMGEHLQKLKDAAGKKNTVKPAY